MKIFMNNFTILILFTLIFVNIFKTNIEIMSEQIVQVENVNPSDLYGANDQHLTTIRSFFPKIKIIARGDFIKIIGEDEEVEYFITRSIPRL